MGAEKSGLAKDVVGARMDHHRANGCLALMSPASLEIPHKSWLMLGWWLSGPEASRIPGHGKVGGTWVVWDAHTTRKQIAKR